MTVNTVDRCVVREPRLAEAEQISRMFEAALGKGGIYTEGCDQYPDPDLFSEQGIRTIIETAERQLIVAEHNGDIVGGAIIDWLGRHHCEINCAAVSRERRGLGIGTRIFAEAKRIIDRNNFTVNTTEFVTHSLASQGGYLAQRPGKFVGFSYCHYPHVFFPNHPESVLWISSLHGTLSSSLSETRQVSVPASYQDIAKKILDQFETLTYEIVTRAQSSANTNARLHIDWKGSYRYCHLTFDAGFDAIGQAKEIDEAVDSLLEKGKQFIFARIRMNDGSALAIAERLQKLGFVFHSILPLYLENAQSTAQNPLFDDVLGMQWIAPSVARVNPWPGETNSVIKLFGYPANLTGALISSIRREYQSRNAD
jgi:GNAT superfamily N-acetyltransferase